MITSSTIAMPSAERQVTESMLAALVRYAVMAPSSHNSQPWRFRIQGDRIELSADRDRRLPIADPEDRELHISLGCALENLLIAIERNGFGHEVEYRIDDEGETVTAVVHLSDVGEPAPFRPRELFDAIEHRRTSHGIYQERPVDAVALASLQACRIDDDMELHLVTDRSVLDEVESMVATADAVQFANPAFRDELAHWVGEGAFGASWFIAKMGQLAIAHLNLGGRFARRDAERFSSAPVFGLIVARQDDHRTHMRVGQMFERIYLTATARGLGLQPMSQLAEVQDIRAELVDLVAGSGWIAQQPFRLGYPSETEKRTPRRPLDAVVDMV